MGSMAGSDEVLFGDEAGSGAVGVDGAFEGHDAEGSCYLIAV